MLTRCIGIISVVTAAGILSCDTGGVYVGEPPGRPYSPTPPNGAVNQPVDTALAWLCNAPADGTGLTYDVYLGPINPPPRVARFVAGASYDAGTLFPGSRYYWKIVAFKGSGDDALVTEGPIWYFDTVSGAWEPVGSPTPADLNDVAFTDDGVGWAVGNGGTILRYDGVSWTNISWPKILDLNAIAISGTDGWAVGDNGTVLRLSNGNWTIAPIGIVTDLYDVSLSDDGSGWLVGAGATVYRLTAGTWAPVDLGDTTDFFCAAVYDASNAWVGGDSNTLYEWDGSEWSQVDVPSYDPAPLTEVYTAAGAYESVGSAVWAGGTGVYFANYVAAVWTFESPPTNEQVNDIRLSDGFGWGVGDGGTILFYDGISWSQYPEYDITSDLNGVFARNRAEAWAVGDDGAIYRYGPVSR